MQSFKVSEILATVQRLGLSRRVFAFLLLLNVLSICFEIIGIGLLLPVFELLREGGSADVSQLEGRHWQVLRDISDFVGIPITLGLLLAISFGFILLRQLFGYFSTRYQGLMARRMASYIRQRAFYRFLKADAAMQDRTHVGEVVSVLKAELARALDVLLSATRSIGVLFQLLSYFGALFVLSPSMALASLTVVALIGFLSRGFLTEIKGRGVAMTNANKQLATFMVERLKHARLIRLSGTERAETAALHAISRRLDNESFQQKLSSMRMELLVEPLTVAIAYLILFFGAHIFGLSLERLGLFAIILIRLVPIIRSAVTLYGTIVGKLPSLERLDAYLTETLQARETRGGDLVFEWLDREIAYDRVSFSYAVGNTAALADITVRIPARRMTALIGPSGAGKSTFVDLLPRLRDPTSGRILFDGIPISSFSIESLRASIAFVPQQPQIFNISAAEHIRYGKEDATDAEVRESARVAGALEFIEALPAGFATPLGDGGSRLSGGQRQRLDIARALVRRAPIVILDEPTSALDADAEAAFRDALQTLRRETDLTIIVIAHRLSTIADADQIIVLNGGRVEACGSHDGLIGGDNWYARAFAKQFGAHSSATAVNLLASDAGG